MFTQSKNEIVYQEDKLLLIGIASPIVALFAWCIEIGAGARVQTTMDSFVAIAILPVAAAVFAGYMLAKRLVLDRLIISTVGITYCRSNSEQHYLWSDLCDPIFVDCGRGSGYYSIDIIGGGKPIHINLAPFGIFRTEFEKVISAARRGKLLNVAELHGEIAKSSRDLKLPTKYVIMTIIVFSVLLASALCFIPPIDFK